MGGPTDPAGVIARGAAEYNSFDLAVRRNVAILLSRIRHEGCFDLYAVMSAAARHAAGNEVGRRETRSADGHAVLSAVASLDAMGEGREARLMRLRMATLLDKVLAVVGTLPDHDRSDALNRTVVAAVRAMPVAAPRVQAPAAAHA